MQESNLGKFHFVNVINNPYNWDEDNQKKDNQTTFTVVQSERNWMQTLFEQLKKISQNSKEPTSILIDNLQFIENGTSDFQFLTFVHYCKLLCQNLQVLCFFFA